MSCCGGTKKIVHGAIGLAKAALHVELADAKVIAERREICRQCDHSEKRLFANRVLISRCRVCGCFIAAKTSLKSESCPLSPPKWGPADAAEAKM